MITTSYAQNFEDVMLLRAFKNVEGGFYIDVGAQDPVVDSVTKAFYDAGWRGINIEPVPMWFEKLQRERPRDINLQVAVSNYVGQARFFEVSDTGLSTLSEPLARRYREEQNTPVVERTVTVTTLTEICRRYEVEEIHFLKVDAEGAEQEVLEGLDLRLFRPWLILAEATVPNLQDPNFESWEGFLLDNRYHFVYFDGLNRFYAADEHSHLDSAFSTPPNYWDSFERLSERNLRKRLEQLKTETQELALRLQEIRISASEKDQEIRQIKSVLDESEKRREEAIAVQGDLMLKIRRLRRSLREEASARRRLQNQLSAMAETAHHRETQLKKAEKQLSRLFEQIETSRHRIEHLTLDSQHWQREAERLNSVLEAVYSSRSWRITSPIRKVSQILRLLFGKPLLAGRTVLQRSSSKLHRLISRTAIYISRRPKAKAMASRLLNSFPNLKQRLRKLANPTRGPGPSTLNSKPGLDTDSDRLQNGPRPLESLDLSPRVSRIYADLKKAIEMNRDR